MRVTLLIFGLVVALLLVLLWLVGGVNLIEARAIAAQRDMQAALADAIRHIKHGEPGAIAALLTLCFTYGVLHAVGPGHGKVLIGGYGLGHRVPWVGLSALALASSLAQSAVAVALVYAAVGVLGWKRDASQALGSQTLAPIGSVVIGVLGLWLIWRGGHAIMRARAASHPGRDHHDHDHDHHHDHDKHDPAHLDHAHAPSLDDMSRLHSFRDAAILIFGIALRPCTGALLLLILTWQLGIADEGIAGAFAMGLGTAVITVTVALLAVWAREGALASLPAKAAARVLPWFEMAAGALVVVIAFGLYNAPA